MRTRITRVYSMQFVSTQYSVLRYSGLSYKDSPQRATVSRNSSFNLDPPFRSLFPPFMCEY